MKRKTSFLIACIIVSLLPVRAETSSDSLLIERLKGHVYTLASDSLEGRKAGTIHGAMARDYITSCWSEIGIDPMHSTGFSDPVLGGQYYNLVGIIPGTDPELSREIIIIGAHYDHLGKKRGKIYNGADDNASGVATLIEMGRMLKQRQSELKRTVILIAFDAEEIGLFGSTSFAKRLTDCESMDNDPSGEIDPQTLMINGLPLCIDNVRLMLSIDMVGWYRQSGKLIYYGSGTLKNGKELLNASSTVSGAASDAASDSVPDAVSDTVYDSLNLSIRKFETSPFTATDTAPFAMKGIPTLAVTTGTKSPYHKPEDEADKIDYEGMALITKHLTDLVIRSSAQEELTPSGRLAKKHKPISPFLFGLSADLGSTHLRYTRGAVDGKTDRSYAVGVFSQFNFGKFALRPEINYEWLSAKYPQGTISTQQITLPLHFVLQSFIMNSGFELYLGGYYSYLHSGKLGEESMDFQKEFYRNQGGISFGFGIYVLPIKLSFTRRIGLTSLNRTPLENKANLQDRTMFMNLSYIF